MYLEKAFDRVPREVISWAMHKVGVEEWLVSAVMSMYTGAKSVWSMKFRVQDQEEDQRGPGQRVSERIVKHVK